MSTVGERARAYVGMPGGLRTPAGRRGWIFGLVLGAISVFLVGVIASALDVEDSFLAKMGIAVVLGAVAGLIISAVLLLVQRRRPSG